MTFFERDFQDGFLIGRLGRVDRHGEEVLRRRVVGIFQYTGLVANGKTGVENLGKCENQRAKASLWENNNREIVR